MSDYINGVLIKRCNHEDGEPRHVFLKFLGGEFILQVKGREYRIQYDKDGNIIFDLSFMGFNIFASEDKPAIKIRGLKTVADCLSETLYRTDFKLRGVNKNYVKLQNG